MLASRTWARHLMRHNYCAPSIFVGVWAAAALQSHALPSGLRATRAANLKIGGNLNGEQAMFIRWGLTRAAHIFRACRDMKPSTARGCIMKISLHMFVPEPILSDPFRAALWL